MPGGYSTRSTTKVARRKAAIAANPLASLRSESSTAVPVPHATARQSDTTRSGSNRRHTPLVAGVLPAPPPSTGTDNRRKPRNPPFPCLASSRSAADGGLPQWGTGPKSGGFMMPSKRAAACDEHRRVPETHSRCTARRQQPAPPAVAPPAVAAAPQQLAAENHGLSGGRGGGGPRRKRSRLALSKRRALPTQQQTVVAEKSPSVVTPSSRTPEQRSCSPFPGPAEINPPAHSKGESSSSSCAVVGCFPGGVSPRLIEGRVGRAGVGTPTGASSPRRAPLERGPPPPPPPPLALPPFVGLENMGETCYVNAVLQSLASCREVLRSNRGTSGAADGENKSMAERSEMDKCEMSSSAVPASNAADGSGSYFVPMETISMGGLEETDGSPVLLALGKVLREMETRNRALFFQQQSAVGSSKISQSLDQVPLTPRVPASEGLQAEAITPTALVELIREGYLSAEGVTEGLAANRTHFRGGVGNPTSMADFGTGQACVSELLGKILDLGAAAAGNVLDDGRRGNSSSGAVNKRKSDHGDNSVCGLAKAFRGTLCVRTLCMECERGRTSCEGFTELTLPPLVPQPSPSGVAAQGATAARNGDGLSKLAQEEARTLQDLVDAMLGREPLEGNNKVWCDVCRQWTEAERRSSLHSPPTLLALHVRPGARKQSLLYGYPYPSSFKAAVSGGFKRRAGGPGEPGQGGGAPEESGEKRELIERVLVVKNASRCQFHDVRAGSDGNNTSSGFSARNLSQPRPEREKGPSNDQPHQRIKRDSGDIFYDLIGVIPHLGQNLGSGHYTFALHVDDATCRSRGHHGPLRAGGVSSAGLGLRQAAPSPGATDRESLPSAPGRGLGLAGEAGGSIEAGSSCTNKPAFALFDDAVVRWLSPGEESALLRGGGGGIGDPFLVFYARRP